MQSVWWQGHFYDFHGRLCKICGSDCKELYASDCMIKIVSLALTSMPETRDRKLWRSSGWACAKLAFTASGKSFANALKCACCLRMHLVATTLELSCREIAVLLALSRELGNRAAYGKGDMESTTNAHSSKNLQFVEYAAYKQGNASTIMSY